MHTRLGGCWSPRGIPFARAVHQPTWRSLFCYDRRSTRVTDDDGAPHIHARCHDHTVFHSHDQKRLGCASEGPSPESNITDMSRFLHPTLRQSIAHLAAMLLTIEIPGCEAIRILCTYARSVSCAFTLSTIHPFDFRPQEQIDKLVNY